MIPFMDIEKLKVFRTFAENNCDTSCHGILGISRALLWLKITALEKEVNAQLVKRIKKHNTLTEAGQALFKHAPSIIEAYEKACLDVQSGGYLQGEIKLSITQAMATGWLLPGLKDFVQNHLDIKLNIVVSDNLQKDIEANSDILLRPLPESSPFTKHWYVEYHHGLYASKEYIEKYGAPQSPDELKNHIVLGYGTYPFTYFEEVNWHIAGSKKIPRLSPNLQINSTPGLFQLAVLGLGIISCPNESTTLYHKNLIRVLPHIQGPTIRTYFATSPNLYKSTENKIEIIKKFIEKHLKKHVPIVYLKK